MWPTAAHVRAMRENTISTCGRLRDDVEIHVNFNNGATSQPLSRRIAQIPAKRQTRAEFICTFLPHLGHAWTFHVHKLMHNSLHALTSHPSSAPSRGIIEDRLHTKLDNDANPQTRVCIVQELTKLKELKDECLHKRFICTSGFCFPLPAPSPNDICTHALIIEALIIIS